MSSKYHKWTEEQIKFLESNIKGKKLQDLTDMFNKHFNLGLRIGQVRSCVRKYKFKSGLLSGPGDGPYNILPVGTESIVKGGYTDIKVAEPSTWRRKHQVIWEEHYGEIPKGSMIIFGDGDVTNFDIDNLLCVTRAQMIRLNYGGLVQNDAELTKAGINLVNLQMKINEVERRR